MNRVTLVVLVACACQPVESPAPETGQLRQAGLTPDPTGTAQLVGGAAGDHFGQAVAAADFNNDGLNEIVVAAPGYSGGVGRVSVYAQPYGTTTNVAFQPSSTLDAGFGWSLAVGNFNGDQFQDLAVGAPGDAPDGGAIFGSVRWFRGSAGGLIFVGTCAGPPGSRFGTALATLHPVGGSQNDLLWVGAPRSSNGGGLAVLLDLTTCVPSTTLVQADAGEFGAALAVTQLSNLDSQPDLMVGAPATSTARGAIYAYAVTGSFNTSLLGNLVGVQPGERFGASVASFSDGHGWAAGGPFYNGDVSGEGKVAASLDGGLASVYDDTLDHPMGRLGSAISEFGSGPNYNPQLAVGAPGVDTVRVYETSRTGLTALVEYVPPAVVAVGSGFGSALDGTRHLGLGDNAPDLIIGAPLQAANGAESGAVYLIAGTVRTVPDGGNGTADSGMGWVDSGIPIMPDGGMNGFDAGVADAGTRGSTAKFTFTQPTPRELLATPVDRTGNQYIWDFGDFSPTLFLPDATAQAHTYGIPGAYHVKLTVIGVDDIDVHDEVVKVRDRFGREPPSATVRQVGVTGDPVGGSAVAIFLCTSDQDAASIRWDFSDDDEDQQRAGPNVSHKFLPGTYRVHCYSENEAGLHGHDWVVVHVPGPTLPPIPAPDCKMALSLPSGPAQLTTVAMAQTERGTGPQIVIRLGNGDTVDEGDTLQFDEGLHAVKLKVMNGGGSCRDHIAAFAFAAPKFTSAPPKQLACGHSLEYLISGDGTGPITLELHEGASPGVEYDPDRNAVLWSSDRKPHTLSFTLTASNLYADTTQSAEVPIECSSMLAFDTCGCSGGPGAGLALLALLVLRRKR